MAISGVFMSNLYLVFRWSNGWDQDGLWNLSSHPGRADHLSSVPAELSCPLQLLKVLILLYLL